MEMMDCSKGCLASLTSPASWAHRASPTKYQPWLYRSNSKISVVSSAPWWTHKSWLCRYWAPAQTETLLLPGFMCYKTSEGCNFSKEHLWTGTHCQPYHAIQGWNISSRMAGTSSASSLILQQRLKKINCLEYKHSLSNVDTHMQEDMHPETTAAICAWQVPIHLQKPLCQRGLGRNSFNSTAFTIHILAEVN